MAHAEAFWKYLSAEGAESVLSNGRLRWSSPILFDDRAEFRRMPLFNPSLAKAGAEFVEVLVNAAAGSLCLDEERLTAKTRLLLGHLRSLVANGRSREALIRGLGFVASNADERFEIEMKSFVERLPLESTRVLCVTIDRDSDVMWETYGEKRRGALLEFRHVPEYSSPLLAAKQVAYAAELPVVGSGLDFLLFGDTRELRVRFLEAIIYTKKAEWRHQHEWRAVTWRTDEGEAVYGDYQFHGAELASVTVGAEASDSWVSQIHGLVAARYPTCKFLRDGRRRASA